MMTLIFCLVEFCVCLTLGLVVGYFAYKKGHELFGWLAIFLLFASLAAAGEAFTAAKKYDEAHQRR